jgi:diacylglycerol kinase (ATP)
VIHLIVNPTAGRGRGLPLVAAAAERLRAAGHDVAVLETTAAGHARAHAHALPAGSTVVAVGGDGTVHEVLPACLERQHLLGLLPAGSGDDFAHALGMSRRDPAAAVAVLIAGRERRVDVGIVNGEPFVNAFGAGFDADVARRIVGAPHAFRGLGRYLYGIVTAMRDFRLATVRIAVDDGTGARTAFDGKALLVSVQNGPRTGGSFLFAPGASVDDGALDVVVAGDFDRLGTFGILPKVMRGAHLGHPRVHRIAARSVDLAWSTPMAAHAEGELLTPAASFAVTLRPRALRVLAP